MSAPDDRSEGRAGAARSDPMATSVLFDVFAVSQAVGRMLAEAMRDGPLTASEYAIASAVFELEAASPTELAARLGMRLTTFMDHLHAMERRGHAARIPHPTDRRSYRVVLTAEGLATHRAANRAFEAADSRFRERLGDQEPQVKAALAAIKVAAESVGGSGPGDRIERVSPRRSGARAG